MKNEIIATRPIIRKIFFTFIFISQTHAQWEGGASFNYKSEIPETGFGVYISRNLPVQFASVGVKARTLFDYYFQQDYSSLELHADLLTLMYYKNFQPYLILSLGGSQYSINDFSEFIFVLGAGVGIRFPVTSDVLPFFEVCSNKYFSSFDKETTEEKISSIQIVSRIGMTLKF